MDETLVQLVKAIQDIAPQVWNIYMKQVMVDGIQIAVWFVVLVVGLIGFFEFKRRNPDTFEYMDDAVKVLLYILILLCGGWAVGMFSGLLGRVLNPEFYAITKLLGVISGN